ncbi:hypothetical protein DUI87_33553 [Hirundo rustica rustica]|uniref:Uncharacterized protein n=1 Tax=Hirundo rustica rustica TaxID=333673 RepID=A0A3M0INP7_HIRRU|nr:hypothetical protein DUI87_33553 [Hirundo rustica rustica]
MATTTITTMRSMMPPCPSYVSPMSSSMAKKPPSTTFHPLSMSCHEPTPIDLGQEPIPGPNVSNHHVPLCPRGVTHPPVPSKMILGVRRAGGFTRRLGVESSSADEALAAAGAGADIVLLDNLAPQHCWHVLKSQCHELRAKEEQLARDREQGWQELGLQEKEPCGSSGTKRSRGQG